MTPEAKRAFLDHAFKGAESLKKEFEGNRGYSGAYARAAAVVVVFVGGKLSEFDEITPQGVEKVLDETRIDNVTIVDHARNVFTEAFKTLSCH